MTDTYQGHDASGQFFAFRKGALPDTLDLFVPSRSHDSKTVHYGRHGTHIKREMAKPGNTFPEEVHAGVFFLQQMLIPGVKKEDLHKGILPWGTHYPRMWRGRFFPHSLYTSTPMDPMDAYGTVYTQSIVAAESLFDKLEDLFRYIEPSVSNLHSYGHRFRELLILACTEVEASWKGILLANTPALPTQRLNTRYYVKLHAPLRLMQWKVVLRDYPDFPELAPFGQWNASDPTATLPWYAAYNATKHDREASFGQASLEHTLSATAAVYILQCAQWGPETFTLFGRNRRSPFAISEYSQWTPGEYYVPEVESDQWTAQPYFATGI